MDDQILAVIADCSEVRGLEEIADALDKWDAPEHGEPRGNARFVASMIRNLLALQEVDGVKFPRPLHPDYHG